MNTAQFISIFNSGGNPLGPFQERVEADGGTVEGLDNMLAKYDASASWQLIPSAVKAGTAYAQVPNSSLGDLTVTRASSGTFTNSAGVVQTAASNVLRTDYRNADGTLSATGRYLLEPQRTNLILQSEDFTSGWSLESATVISNTTTAPSNVIAADTLQETANTDVHRTYRSAITITSGTPYAFTCYVKKDTNRFVRLIFNNSSSSTNWVAAQFDLDTQTFTSGVGSGGGTFVSASIRGAANGFYRIELVSSLATTGAFAMIALSNGTAISSTDSRGSASYLGSTSNRIFVWGAQLELGAYATTYIPTTTAAVTRLADSASKTGVSSLIGQTEGTMFFDFYLSNVNATTNRVLMYILSSGNPPTNGIRLEMNSTSGLFAVVRSNNSNTLTTAPISLSAGNNRIALSYKSGDIAIYINGIQAITSTVSFTFTTSVDKIALENSTAGANTLSDGVSQAALFPTRLDNAELAQLTTL